MPSITYDRLILSPVNLTVTDQDGLIVSTPINGTGTWTHNTLNKVWVRTPGFLTGRRNKTIRRGDLPMNDFTYRKEKIMFPLGGYTKRVTTSPGQYRDHVYTGAYSSIGDYPHVIPGTFSGPPMPPFDLNVLDEMARTKTLLFLKDQKVNLWQAFAERKQTARLLGNTIKRFSAAVTSLKKGSLAGAAKALGVKSSPRRIRKYTKSYAENQSKAIANGWLELQYGWRPFLSDIYGSAELIAQKTMREVRSRAVKSASMKAREITRLGGITSPEVYYDLHREVTIKYVIYYSTPSEVHTLAQAGITNPALIAWELTPWSFVVDWLIPIGNYISSLDSTKGLVFEKGCRTSFERLTVFGRCKSGALPDPNYSYDFGGDSSQYSLIDCVRSSISDFPRTALPSVKSPFSTIHVLNGLALLRTSFTIR